jgi:hypothetical protein
MTKCPTPLLPAIMDHQTIAQQIYELASSQDSLAPLVSEALHVIEEAIDAHGCAFYFL